MLLRARPASHRHPPDEGSSSFTAPLRRSPVELTKFVHRYNNGSPHDRAPNSSITARTVSCLVKSSWLAAAAPPQPMISPLRALVSSTTFRPRSARPEAPSAGRRNALVWHAGIFVTRQDRKTLIDCSALPRRKSTLAAMGEPSRSILRYRHRAIIDISAAVWEPHSSRPCSASTRCMTSRLISPAISFRTWAPSTRSASGSPRRPCSASR
ncbi:hypothetical protein GA0061098_103633 [Bradyrhizobium shewense]|uniref:Uncharacterized protein n=1 Tax=Bradyrhizobium shewense TaxID=1761772 RepID=A0A1C3XSE6_9BRAD|nr:hypothetical protein GA0061098_103633 [Bradyrhizobium shewense]